MQRCISRADDHYVAHHACDCLYIFLSELHQFISDTTQIVALAQSLSAIAQQAV